MNIPGFSADASLYRTSAHQSLTVGIAGSNTRKPGVTPAFSVSDLPISGIFCDDTGCSTDMLLGQYYIHCDCNDGGCRCYSAA